MRCTRRTRGHTHWIKLPCVRRSRCRPHLQSERLPPPADGLVALARACLDDMKADDAVVIDLVGRTSIADAMIIASGTSQRHVGSIAEKLVTSLKDHGHGRVRVEGMPACDWVLIDAGDLIVHIFRPEVRGFYNLEKMWGRRSPARSGRRLIRCEARNRSGWASEERTRTRSVRALPSPCRRHVPWARRLAAPGLRDPGIAVFARHRSPN